VKSLKKKNINPCLMCREKEACKGRKKSKVIGAAKSIVILREFIMSF